MPTETTPAVPMTLEERARAVADKYDEMHRHSGIGSAFATLTLASLIAEALRTVRNEALEEAAAFADADEYSLTGSEVAVGIRSLKESP